MDELKEILQLVGDVSVLTAWVLAGYLAYKLALIGSIYGLVRFGLGRLFDWLQQRKVEYKEIRLLLDGEVISGVQENNFISLLKQIKQKVPSDSTGLLYIHGSHIEWLRTAMNEKLERDSKESNEIKTKINNP